MSSQKYNVLLMYKNKFMQFKTNAPTFSFFLAGWMQAGGTVCWL